MSNNIENKEANFELKSLTFDRDRDKGKDKDMEDKALDSNSANPRQEERKKQTVSVSSSGAKAEVKVKVNVNVQGQGQGQGPMEQGQGQGQELEKTEESVKQSSSGSPNNNNKQQKDKDGFGEQQWGTNTAFQKEAIEQDEISSNGSSLDLEPPFQVSGIQSSKSQKNVVKNTPNVPPGSVLSSGGDSSVIATGGGFLSKVPQSIIQQSSDNSFERRPFQQSSDNSFERRPFQQERVEQESLQPLHPLQQQYLGDYQHDDQIPFNIHHLDDDHQDDASYSQYHDAFQQQIPNFKVEQQQQHLPLAALPLAQQQELHPTQIHDYHSSSSSSNEAPPSIQFETQPLIPHDNDNSNGSSESNPLLSHPHDFNMGYSNSRRLGRLPLRAGAGISGAGRSNSPNHSNTYTPTPTQTPTSRRRSEHQQNDAIMSWKDVVNHDEFLARLYEYYKGKGIVCMVVSASANLLTVAFVITLTVFVTHCLDYNLIPKSRTLSEIIIPNCYARLGWLTTTLVVSTAMWWIYTLIRTLFHTLPLLIETKNFVNDVLGVQDASLQTMLWRDFCARIVASHGAAISNSRNSNGLLTGVRLDARIIANRIMRRENYVIAMFNKEIMTFTLPGMGNFKWLTRLMVDYIIYWGVLGEVFDNRGQVKRRFLKGANRARLIMALKKRFRKMAFFSFLLSPLLFIYLIIQTFFKLSEEYRQNPQLLSARAYSPLSTWHLREYNELPHLFDSRIARSHSAASTYLAQFPNALVVILARFLSFICGSFASVLVIITLFEEELQQGFEITPNRSALFYIGVFGSILALTQGFTQEQLVHEPGRWMAQIVKDTHYLPDEWRGLEHTEPVRQAFARMFEHRIVGLGYELLSVLLLPFFLYTSGAECAGEIVDFFREFTVKVEGVGYMCSFAVFDFERHGDNRFGSRDSPNNDRMMSKNGKMEQSFMNFKSNNPDWDPGQKGSEYLSKVVSRRLPHGGISSRIIQMSNSEVPAGSYMQGDSVISGIEGEENVVREIVGLLDAFYVSHRY